jgi:hypothetical protein
MLLTLIALAQAVTAPPAAPAPPSRATDICLAMVPPRLAVQLERENPDYELPVVADAPLERLLAIAESGAWPCPFVAIGDFDGDGNLDRALVLKHKTEPTVRVIAAHNDGNQWRVQLQKDWPIKIADASIAPLEAGLYEQTKGGRDAAKQIDNLKSIQSDHAGFVVGPVEGGKRGFFFINDAWDEIWLEE